jgi:hypothetical protein
MMCKLPLCRISDSLMFMFGCLNPDAAQPHMVAEQQLRMPRRCCQKQLVVECLQTVGSVTLKMHQSM